ncbi:MAG: replication protein, partial [Niallia sp.]
MNLLINEPPLQVLPSLAVRIGLNKAIVIQQMHYWLIRSDHVYEDKRWIYNSVTEWLEQFPFWSRSTLTRIIDDLENDNLLFVGNFNKKAMDRTKWYSINYDDERLYSAFSQNEQMQ